MPEGEKIGAAFVEIGGDISPLDKAYGESLRITEESLRAISSMSSRMGDGMGVAFASAAQGITGPGGIVAAIGKVFEALTDVGAAAKRFEFAAGAAGVQDVPGFKADIAGLAPGTPFTVRQMMDAGRKAMGALGEGVAPEELLTTMKHAIGATILHPGRELGDLVVEMARARRGEGGGGLIPELPQIAQLGIRRQMLAQKYGPAYEAAMAVHFQQFGLGRGGAMLSDAIDIGAEYGGAGVEFLMGGFTPDQMADAGSKMRTMQTGLGPTARGLGHRYPGMLPPHLQAINAAEVAADRARPYPTPAPGVFRDPISEIRTIHTPQPKERALDFELRTPLPGRLGIDQPATLWQSMIDSIAETINASMGVQDLGITPTAATNEDRTREAVRDGYIEGKRQTIKGRFEH